MRLLHTSDWHLGKRLFGIDRLSETEAALKEVVTIAEREKVDAVLVTGDLLDRRLIDPAALGACLRAMEELATVAPVLAVVGNHDDPDLWIHLAPHLARSNIHVAGRVLPASEAILTLKTAAGPLHAALLPWPEPARMAVEAGVSIEEVRSKWASQVAAVLRRYAKELLDRRRAEGGYAVLLGHLMVERARAGGGEREMTLGIAWTVSVSSVPSDLDYVALGHVHRPQSIAGLEGAGRYAGSPIALDFSDEGMQPSVCILEVGTDRTEHRLVNLTAGRPLVRLRGPLEGLAALAAEHPDALFACEVELDAPVMDLVRRVREEVPGALRVEARYPDAPEATPADGGEEGGGPGAGLADLYAEWHRSRGRALSGAQAAAFAEALAGALPDDALDEG